MNSESTGDRTEYNAWLNKLEKMDDAKKYYQYILDNYPGTEKANTAANYVDAQ